MNTDVAARPAETRTPSVSHQLAEAANAIRRGHYAIAQSLLDEVTVRRRRDAEQHGPAELRLLQALRSLCERQTPTARLAPPTEPLSDSRLGRVGDGQPRPEPGVSIVTCCMNRSENLLRALPTWLAHERVNEVVIVDWSSREPVAETLAAAGISDTRIRIVRVIDEPRWILSFAFNLGFRFARHELILKVDADITLKPDFFDANPLRERMFIAGDWRAAEKGQEHINGFFYAYQVDLLRIKGFNEYITTYGWDDDDIYSRLLESGTERVCVDTRSIYHLPHDDAQRIGGVHDEPECAWQQLQSDTLFKIRANRFLSLVMPPWNKDRQFAPFEILGHDGHVTRVRRLVAELPHIVSEDFKRDAELHAAFELVSWRVGPQAYHVPKARFRALLSIKRLEEIGAFGIAIASDDSAPFDSLRRHNVLLEFRAAACDAEHLEMLLTLLVRALDAQTVGVFLLGATPAQQAQAERVLGSRAVNLTRWVTPKGLRPVEPDELPRLPLMLSHGPGLWLRVDKPLLVAAAELAPSVRHAPLIIARRKRLYIDVQHGLGNRLRAYASAAVVARRTERELVLLWAPDHHCGCRFTDLFENQVALIESPEEVPRTGVQRHTYMEAEAGANKSALIDLEVADDVLVRSAYVINHPTSQWADENEQLRALRPVSEVRDLVASVSVDGCIGAHVRMEAGKGLDRNSYDSVDNWTQESHDQIQYWRGKSHYSAFLKRIDTLFDEQPSRNLFLATDMLENYEVFHRTYGDRLRFLKRQAYDRSREQIIYALADAILLSRCELLLGSTWSSFSELAMRLSTTFSKIEMSGKDF